MVDFQTWLYKFFGNFVGASSFTFNLVGTNNTITIYPVGILLGALLLFITLLIPLIIWRLSK